MRWGQYKQTHFALYSMLAPKQTTCPWGILNNIKKSFFFSVSFGNDATAKFTTRDSGEKSVILGILLIETVIICAIFCIWRNYRQRYVICTFEDSFSENTLVIRGWFLNLAQTEFPQGEFLLYFHLDRQGLKAKSFVFCLKIPEKLSLWSWVCPHKTLSLHRLPNSCFSNDYSH